MVPFVVDGAAEEALVVHFGTNTAGEAAFRLQALRGVLGKKHEPQGGKKAIWGEKRRPHVLSAHDRHGGSSGQAVTASVCGAGAGRQRGREEKSRRTTQGRASPPRPQPRPKRGSHRTPLQNGPPTPTQ